MTYKTPEERAAYAREWRAKHPERAKEIDAKKREKQPVGAATERMRRWREANPEKAKAQNARYYERHKEEELARQRKHREANIEHYREYNARWHRENRANNPQKVRAMHLKSLYGLTLEQYEAMLITQGGTCATCSRTPDQERHKVLHVDHCHDRGHVRGLLCSRCNTGVGLADHSIERLNRWIEYLQITPP